MAHAHGAQRRTSFYRQTPTWAVALWQLGGRMRMLESHVSVGAIVDAVASAGCVNPIILLDEVDKISTDARGDECLTRSVKHIVAPS